MMDGNAGVAPVKEAEATRGFLSFLRRLFADSRDREKRRALRRIAKEVKKHRPRLYEPRRGTVEPPLAQLLHDLYCALFAAQHLFAEENLYDVLKVVVINGSLSNRQLEMRARLEDDTLRERVAGESLGKVVREVKAELGTFVKEFDRKKVTEIEERYHIIRVFLDLAKFDYLLLLRHFDPNMPANDPNYLPSFGSCEARMVAEPLIGFAEIVGTVDCGADWDGPLETLKVYKGFNVVSRDKWMKALRVIKRLQDSQIVLLMLKLMEDDPDFAVDVTYRGERVVAPYLSKYKLQVALSLEKIQRELKGKRIEKLLKEVFDGQQIPQLSNYTEESSAKLARRNLPSYRYVNEMRYAKAFLTDFYKSRIRELIRMLVVKGEWHDTVLARKLSDSNQKLTEKLEALRQLDDGLAEEKPAGSNLRSAVYRMIRNKANKPAAVKIVDQINTQAGEIIRDVGEEMKALNTILRKIHADVTAKNEAVLLNWEALMRHSGDCLPENMLEIEKKIDAFVKIVEVSG